MSQAIKHITARHKSLPNKLGHCQRSLTFTQIFQTSLKCNQFSATTVKTKHYSSNIQP